MRDSKSLESFHAFYYIFRGVVNFIGLVINNSIVFFIAFEHNFHTFLN
jgi:hypothetical protein